MNTIQLYPLVGEFAENKDIARDIRIRRIVPLLEQQTIVTLDFDRVTGATQSFIHALISELFRQYGNTVLDRIRFKNCNETVQKIITIVTEYMQEAQ